MRSNGVPKFPDPNSTNEGPSGLPKVSLQQLGVSSSQLQAAQTACRHLLPNGGRSSPAASQQMVRKLVNFAQCMRSHGVSNWPDPTPSTPAMEAQGAPSYMFHMHGLQSLDGRSFSPQITTAMHECFHLTGMTDSGVPWGD
jgi:hypothetical protein